MVYPSQRGHFETLAPTAWIVDNLMPALNDLRPVRRCNAVQFGSVRRPSYIGDFPQSQSLSGALSAAFS
jgi:hypothetical protein